MGIARETAFGTPVVPTTTSPMTNCTYETDPGLFFPKVAIGQRDMNVFPGYGQFKRTGAVEGPLFPTNGVDQLVYAIGEDVGQSGTAPGGTQKIGTLAAAVAGATSLIYTLSSGAAPVIGDYFQIGSLTNGKAGAIAGSQVVLVSNVTGTGSPYTLTVAPLAYKVDTTGNGGAGLNGSSVVDLFWHYVQQKNLLPSMTVEKNMGDFQSYQYNGVKINKYDLKLGNANTEAGYVADGIAKGLDILDTPSSIITPLDEGIFVFAEAALDVFSNDAFITNIALSIENGLKATYVWGSHDLTFSTPVTRHVSGTFDVVFTSIDDPDWGYFTKMMDGDETPFTMSLTHPNTGGVVEIDLDLVRLSKNTDAIKFEDVIMTTLAWEARLDLSTLNTIAAYIANGNYQPY